MKRNSRLRTGQTLIHTRRGCLHDRIGRTAFDLIRWLPRLTPLRHAETISRWNKSAQCSTPATCYNSLWNTQFCKNGSSFHLHNKPECKCYTQHQATDQMARWLHTKLNINAQSHCKKATPHSIRLEADRCRTPICIQQIQICHLNRDNPPHTRTDPPLTERASGWR